LCNMMVKKLTIISLSRGILGENFIRHELKIGVKRLEAYGIQVQFAEHALSGLAYVEKHPEKRAEDLLKAFQSDTDMILCAVGGEDTYRLLPYLFEHDGLKKAVRNKIFLGFSDSTMNHLMLHKVGLNTFYGQAFLPDICELAPEMLPYSKKYFEELIMTGRISKITPSEDWYSCRTDFSEEAVGSSLPRHQNQGFELLQGAPVFSGPILGGCIDTIYDIFNRDRFADTVELCRKYELFPTREEWKGKILLLESSEEQATPEKYRRMLTELKKAGVFEEVRGVLVGKPADEVYFEEYKAILKEVIADPSLPVVTNINVGHALPRCIIPFGVEARVDVNRQEILFES